MEAEDGIDSGKPKLHKRKFDLFRPVSVKPDGRRIQSANWCVRFQHKGKRTCRSLGTADYRLASQRAKQLVASVRQRGWSGAALMPTSHSGLSIDDLLEQYHRNAILRSLRPRSIADAEKSFRRVCREVAARRLNDLTPTSLQQWVQDCGLRPVSLRSVLRNAASLFAKHSLQAMGMADVQNLFAKLVLPKVDREAFPAPPRKWITELMRQGVRELDGDTRLAFVLALGAGLRWGEIISLDWADVQTDSIRVTASKAKGRRTRVVPVSKLVRSVLEPRRNQGTVITGNAKEVHASLCAWLRKQGVTDAKPVHYLRKCFGSLAVGDHGIFIASKLLGHASISITASTYAGQVDQLPAVKF